MHQSGIHLKIDHKPAPLLFQADGRMLRQDGSNRKPLTIIAVEGWLNEGWAVWVKAAQQLLEQCLSALHVVVLQGLVEGLQQLPCVYAVLQV